MDDSPQDMQAHHRVGDPPIKIVREVPLWGLVTALALIAGQAISMFITQARQGDAQVALATQITAQTEQIKHLAQAVTSNNLKDMEHDMKIQQLEKFQAVVQGVRRQ